MKRTSGPAFSDQSKRSRTTVYCQIPFSVSPVNGDIVLRTNGDRRAGHGTVWCHKRNTNEPKIHSEAKTDELSHEHGIAVCRESWESPSNCPVVQSCPRVGTMRRSSQSSGAKVSLPQQEGKTGNLPRVTRESQIETPEKEG